MKHKCSIIFMTLCLFFVSSVSVYSVESSVFEDVGHIHIPPYVHIENEDSNSNTELVIIDNEIDTPVVFKYVGEFDCAANCCEDYIHICGGTGITANGMPQTAGITAGANFDVLSAGSWIYIEDVGVRQVQDTGPRCPENHIDVAVETHEEALDWAGWGIHKVWILEVKDED